MIFMAIYMLIILVQFVLTVYIFLCVFHDRVGKRGDDSADDVSGVLDVHSDVDS